MASSRLLRLAALVALTAPLVAGALVFFGGGTVGNCHEPVGDSPGALCPVEVLVAPWIRTDAGMTVSLIIAAVAWLLATSLILGHLMTSDRPRLARLAVRIGVIGAAMAGVGFANGLTVRLRYAAEGGLAWGMAGLVLGWLIAVVWVGLRPEGAGWRPIPNSTGRP